jgi:acetyl-CoA acetyltransferase
VVELYDAFTINTLLFLEDLGFCPKGEGGRFVEGGRIAPGRRAAGQHQRRRPVVRAPRHVRLFTADRGGAAAARRRRRSAGGGREPLALAHGNGGVLSSQATAILGSEPTRAVRVFLETETAP